MLLKCRDVLKKNIEVIYNSKKFALMESVQTGRPIKEMKAQLVKLILKKINLFIFKVQIT